MEKGRKKKICDLGNSRYFFLFLIVEMLYKGQRALYEFADPNCISWLPHLKQFWVQTRVCTNLRVYVHKSKSLIDLIWTVHLAFHLILR